MTEGAKDASEYGSPLWNRLIGSWCIRSKNSSGCYCRIGESPFSGIEDDVLAESACNCVWQAWEHALVEFKIQTEATLSTQTKTAKVGHLKKCNFTNLHFPLQGLLGNFQCLKCSKKLDTSPALESTTVSEVDIFGKKISQVVIAWLARVRLMG